ncbi:MAG: hypothetical protein NTY29_06390 [Proteobacteria bacterium]|nr:hypothetical protein [Pseudomonadota bacterium]
MILGICGSGRKEGNTGGLIEEVLKATGGESELIWLIDLNLGYCTGCMRWMPKPSSSAHPAITARFPG